MAATKHSFDINGRTIGASAPPYIIAEMSGNHNGDINRALTLMKEAHKAGADAVKLQTYTADSLTINHDGPDFRIEGGLWDGRLLYDLYQEACTPLEWHETLFNKGKELGITVFSTPFDEEAVELLDELNTPAYKIASFELLDIPLLRQVAHKHKPIIMSTGMANIADINTALETVRQITDAPVALLHCISSYPAPIEQSNLKTLQNLAETFDVVSGLSDHTIGATAAITATALGASLIEKHFTLARSDGGPDAAFSLEPDELKHLVTSCREAHQSIGQVTYQRAQSEEKSLTFRRSIYIIKDIAQGEELTHENTRIIRPGYGLSPVYFDQVLGKKATQNLKRGDALTWEMIT